MPNSVLYFVDIIFHHVASGHKLRYEVMQIISLFLCVLENSILLLDVLPEKYASPCVWT